MVGCSFSNQTDNPDANTVCPFQFEPKYIDPCTPPPPVPLVNITIANTASIDTANGVISGGVTAPPSSVVDGVRVVWTRNFTIASGITLRAYGDLPLLVIATEKIHILGTVDVSTTAFSKGAGADPAVCATTTAGGPGEQCTTFGGSGGGGGGFGFSGSPGGEGGDGNTCTATDGKPGGKGGLPLSTPPPALRGGCRGGDGAISAMAQSMPGVAGAGGGAVGFIAGNSIVVDGTIHAGGGGGFFGTERAGGGGGGSGGMIFLEAPDVELVATSLLAANGGGGGGGVDNGTAMVGETGHPSITNDAAGGSPDNNGGTGGNGGYVAARTGTPGGLAGRGGGGGGGGVGYIVVHHINNLLNGGMASPLITTE